MTETFHATVHGRVQGVCFRAATQQQARELGVVGWIRNCADGSVELCAAGDRLDEFRRWLEHGPPHARVDHIETLPPTEAALPEGFEIR